MNDLLHRIPLMGEQVAYDDPGDSNFFLNRRSPIMQNE